MRPEGVVLISPVGHEQAGFFQRTEAVLVEAAIAEGAFEAIDQDVLHGLASLDVFEMDLTSMGTEVNGLARELGPLSQMMERGVPTESQRASIRSATAAPPMEVSTSERHALAAGLLADAAGVAASLVICRLVFR